METNYSRKQNTDNYQLRIERQLTKGEEVLRRVREKIDNYEDVVRRSQEVNGWLLASRVELTHIYKNDEVLKPLKASSGFALEEASRQDIIESLEAMVSERIAALEEIARQTRAYDGKEKETARSPSTQSP